MREERQTLHVMYDQRRIAMVETKTWEDDVEVGTPVSRWRYQLENHLGSSAMELDHEGEVISYEDYHPYGTTAFHTMRGGAEVSAKRYRYTGKERDEETGLYYHGARYYAPWLGRWTAADPLGLAEPGRPDLNMYAYVEGNAVGQVDPSGMQEWNMVEEHRTPESDWHPPMLAPGEQQAPAPAEPAPRTEQVQRPERGLLRRIRDFINPPQLQETAEMPTSMPARDYQIQLFQDAQAEPHPGQTLGDEGLDLLIRWEGTRLDQQRLQAGERIHVPYEDIAGHATLGYGHLLHHGPLTPADIEQYGSGITEEQARELLRQDVQRFEEAVRDAVAVDLTQEQFDALLVFAYNIGDGGFRTSSALRELNAGNMRAAADAMLLWNQITRGNQRVVDPGLTNRRRSERQLFLRGTR